MRIRFDAHGESQQFCMLSGDSVYFSKAGESIHLLYDFATQDSDIVRIFDGLLEAQIYADTFLHTGD